MVQSATPPRAAQERIGRYEVLRRIATGGMAELFLAKHVGMEGFEKVVAIKRILAHLAHDDEFVNMFRDEARLVAKLSHPNIVQIYDLGKSADSYFIAMEYIPGRNLASIAKKTRKEGTVFPPLYVARAMAQACEALHYAHTRQDGDGRSMGIVHRDVSPQNIILAFSGAVKLVDFGIAKAATKIAHTRAGVLKGKYAYMSPEQIKGEEIDARSDVFSVGIVLFELLCGKRPFEKENSIQTLKAIVQDAHVDPRDLNPEVPDGIAEIIHRALTKDRNQRYQTAQEVQLALEDFVSSTGERINAVVVGEWVTALFDDELDRGKGGVVQLKGGGEVILPESEKMERSDREEASDVPLDDEDEAELAAADEAPAAAPSLAGGSVRGGGSIMGRDASVPGERMRLLEEGVIGGDVAVDEDEGDEEATAIATGEAEPDLIEASAAVGPVADAIEDDRPLYEEPVRAHDSEPPGYDDSRTELAGDALMASLQPQDAPDATVEAERVLARPGPSGRPRSSLSPPKASLTPAKAAATPSHTPAPSRVQRSRSSAPPRELPPLIDPDPPLDLDDGAPLDLGLDGLQSTAFGDDATLLPGAFESEDPWGDKTTAEPGSEDYTPDGGVIVRDAVPTWSDATAADDAMLEASEHAPSIDTDDRIAPVDPWDDKTSASVDDPAEGNESSRVAVFDADDDGGWGDKTVGLADEGGVEGSVGFGGDLAIDATAGMSVEEIAAKLNSARGDKTAAMPALFHGDDFAAPTSEPADWSPAAPEGGSTDEWEAARASFDESALPAGVDATRNVELDSSTVAATMSDYAEEGIEVGVANAFAYDEPTRGSDVEPPPSRPRNALGAIRLAKVSAAPPGGVEELSSGGLDEPTSELGTEQFLQRPLSPAPPRVIPSERPRAVSPPPGEALVSPLDPLRAFPVGHHPLDVPSVSGEGTYNEPVLPPGGAILGDFDLDALLAPAVPSTLMPPDPLAAMGSTRVPPANVSLSEMLLDRSQSIPTSGRTAPPRGASGAGAPLKSASMIRGASVAGSAPPRSSSMSGPASMSGASMLGSAPPRAATNLRAIKETRRPGTTNSVYPPGPSGLTGLGTPIGDPMASMTGPIAPGQSSAMGMMGTPSALSLQLAPPPRPRARMTTAQLVTIVVSCVVIAVVLGAIGYVKLRPPSLEIRTSPAGAQVFLGGAPLPGITPLSVPIEPDREYTIRIVRTGFEDYERTVRIPRDRKALMVSFTLTPSAPGP